MRAAPVSAAFLKMALDGGNCCSPHIRPLYLPTVSPPLASPDALGPTGACCCLEPLDGELFAKIRKKDKLEQLELINLSSMRVPTVSSPLPTSPPNREAASEGSGRPVTRIQLSVDLVSPPKIQRRVFQAFLSQEQNNFKTLNPKP